ncbi:MAG TPA: hypothetical protein VJT81_05445 [Burkholderiales bacterium]|nr:hypothetical protein [Burkholderiales bacterium]
MKLTNTIAHVLLSSTLLLGLSGSADAAGTGVNRFSIFPDDEDEIWEVYEEKCDAACQRKKDGCEGNITVEKQQASCKKAAEVQRLIKG